MELARPFIEGFLRSEHHDCDRGRWHWRCFFNIAANYLIKQVLEIQVAIVF